MDNQAKLLAGAWHTVMARAMIAKHRGLKGTEGFNLTAHPYHGSGWSYPYLSAPDIKC